MMKSYENFITDFFIKTPPEMKELCETIINLMN